METDDFQPGCSACEQLAAVALPPRDAVVPTEHGRPTTERHSLALAVRAALGRPSQLTSEWARDLGSNP